MRPLPLAALVACLAACRSGASGAAQSAALTTAVAAGVAGARRASGECYAACPPGTRCDPSDGTCVAIPCRGQCQQWERCDETGLIPRCAAAAPFEVTGQRELPSTRGTGGSEP